MKGTGPNRDRSQQTPGPWTAWQDPIDKSWRITHKLPDNRVIVGVVADEGDAKLIVAVHDLATALERTVNALDVVLRQQPLRDATETFAEAKSALEKAGWL